jgi:hypothetical protein
MARAPFSPPSLSNSVTLLGFGRLSVMTVTEQRPPRQWRLVARWSHSAYGTFQRFSARTQLIGKLGSGSILVGTSIEDASLGLDYCPCEPDTSPLVRGNISNIRSDWARRVRQDRRHDPVTVTL